MRRVIIHDIEVTGEGLDIIILSCTERMRQCERRLKGTDSPNAQDYWRRQYEDAARMASALDRVRQGN